MNDFSTDQIHRRDVDRTIRRGTWVVPIVSYIFLHALTSWLLFLSGSLPTSLSFSSLEINFFLSLFLLGRLARTTQVSQGAALIWKAYLPMRFHRWRYSNSPEFSFNAIYMTHRVCHITGIAKSLGPGLAIPAVWKAVRIGLNLRFLIILPWAAKATFGNEYFHDYDYLP